MLTENEWEICNERCMFLKPFEAATTEMSGENYVTASKVIVMVKGIKSVTEKTMVRCNKAKEFGQKLIDCMHKSSRFLNIENSKTNASSSLLDPRFKLVTAIINVRKAESVVTDTGTTIPTSSPHTDETKDLELLLGRL